MTTHPAIGLYIFQACVIILGIILATKSFTIYQHDTKARSFFFLGIGFLALSLGMTVESFLVLMGIDMNSIHLLETILAILGLISIIRAIHLIKT